MKFGQVEFEKSWSRHVTYMTWTIIGPFKAWLWSLDPTHHSFTMAHCIVFWQIGACVRYPYMRVPYRFFLMVSQVCRSSSSWVCRSSLPRAQAPFPCRPLRSSLRMGFCVPSSSSLSSSMVAPVTHTHTQSCLCTTYIKYLWGTLWNALLITLQMESSCFMHCVPNGSSMSCKSMLFVV